MDLLSNQFFAAFSKGSTKTLTESVVERKLEAHEILFDEGSVADGVYLILEGSVQLSKKSGERTVDFLALKAGDYFGEVGVLDGRTRSARVTMKEAGRIAKIPAEVVLKVLRQEPADATFRLFKKILNQLRTTTDRFATEVLRKEKLHAIGEMAGTIIHDFKNPITAIECSAEMIGHRHKDSATQKSCDIIVRQSERMVMMVQELLDFARGKVHLRDEVKTVASFFEEFQLLNQDLFNRSQIKVMLRPIETKVRIDLSRMMRVLQNLVVNAMEAMEGKGEILISAREGENGVEIYVKDNGPGIPEAIRDTLFDSFVSYGKKDGTGLGMAIAKMMVEAHQGQLSFQTETGRGTTFSICLPKVF